MKHKGSLPWSQVQAMETYPAPTQTQPHLNALSIEHRPISQCYPHIYAQVSR
jgi:hypothetical protein